MEKILGENEPLPQFPGVAGTTGYEWLNVISRLLLDGRGLAVLDRPWRDISHDDRAFGEILQEAKHQVLENILAAEFKALARLLARIAAGDFRTRDHSYARLRAALELFILHFPVYRTYITAAGASPRAIAPSSKRRSAAARAQWRGTDGGDLRFPARCPHARSDREPVRPATAPRGCDALLSRCSNSPAR